MTEVDRLLDEAFLAYNNKDFDEAEDIETVLVAPSELAEFIRKEDAAGNGIDIKVAAYSAALS